MNYRSGIFLYLLGLSFMEDKFKLWYFTTPTSYIPALFHTCVLMPVFKNFFSTLWFASIKLLLETGVIVAHVFRGIRYIGRKEVTQVSRIGRIWLRKQRIVLVIKKKIFFSKMETSGQHQYCRRFLLCFRWIYSIISAGWSLTGWMWR